MDQVTLNSREGLWYMGSLKKCLIAGLILLIPLASQAAMLNDISFWLQNLQDIIPQIFRLIVAISYVTGILFVTMGVFKLKAYGQMTVYQSASASMGGPLIFFFIGILLIALPGIVDVVMYSIWGYGAEGAMRYEEAFGSWSEMIAPVIMIIQIIGYISFFRGWIMISKLGTSGAAPGTMSKGATHIIGGIIAINILGTWEIIANTLQG